MPEDSKGGVQVESQRVTRLATEKLFAKFYLNGFPKSGLHMLTYFMYPLAKPLEPDILLSPWAGMFQGNSWTRVPHKEVETTFRVGRVTDGHFLQGHMGWTPGMNTFMYNLGLAHIFIYRDFRDVAVSQLHHIMEGESERQHPDKEYYREMGYDKALSAIIVGEPEYKYPSVMERWKDYAPWLKEDWVYRVSFEEMLAEPYEKAVEIIYYMRERLNTAYGLEVEMDTEKIERVAASMVILSTQTYRSPTYRKGKSGGWRERFDSRHIDEFKEADKDNELVRLGFESRLDWNK